MENKYWIRDLDNRSQVSSVMHQSAANFKSQKIFTSLDYILVWNEVNFKRKNMVDSSKSCFSTGDDVRSMWLVYMIKM